MSSILSLSFIFVIAFELCFISLFIHFILFPLPTEPSLYPSRQQLKSSNDKSEGFNAACLPSVSVTLFVCVEAKALKDEATLESAGVVEGSVLYFKDLGMSILSFIATNLLTEVFHF